MFDHDDAPAPSGRTGAAVRDPDPRREDAAGGEPAARDQGRTPTGDDADRRAQFTAGRGEVAA